MYTKPSQRTKQRRPKKSNKKRISSSISGSISGVRVSGKEMEEWLQTRKGQAYLKMLQERQQYEKRNPIIRMASWVLFIVALILCLQLI